MLDIYGCWAGIREVEQAIKEEMRHISIFIPFFMSLDLRFNVAHRVYIFGWVSIFRTIFYNVSPTRIQNWVHVFG